MPNILPKIVTENKNELGWDDLVLGRAMKSENVKLFAPL